MRKMTILALLTSMMLETAEGTKLRSSRIHNTRSLVIFDLMVALLIADIIILEASDFS